MASTYTGLGTQLMATGENAGTWGTKTNTNLNIIEQIAGGYIEVAVTSTPTTLSVSDGSTGAALAHRCITFTGEISENTVVTIPLDVQTFYIIKNSVSGGSSASYTVQFKYVSGSGSSVTWAAGDTGTKIVYATADDATNPNIVDATSAFVTASSTTTLTNKTFTAPVYADGGYIADANGNENLVWGTTSSAVNEFKIANAATGAGPTLSSQGGDSNVDINITPKGTGDVVLSADTVTVGDAAAAATLRSSGAGTLTVTTGGATDLILSTNNGTTSSNITITDAAGGDVTVTPSTTGSLIVQGNSTQAGTLKLYEDTDLGSYYAGFRPSNLTENTLYVLPTADAGTSGDALTSNASGTLSWTTMSGGTSWQAVDTSAFTAVAGEGYFCNTTSAAFTATLPSSPSLGDECTFVDYAGTFDSYNLTVGRNSEKINGASADLTVAVERAAFTLVYTDGTQGWLLKDK